VLRELAKRLRLAIDERQPLTQALGLVRPRRGRPAKVLTGREADLNSAAAACMTLWLDENPGKKPEHAAPAIASELGLNRTRVLKAFRGYTSDACAKMIVAINRRRRNLLRKLARRATDNVVPIEAARIKRRTSAASSP